MERETAEVEITWEGKKAKVTVHELLEGEHQDILREAVVTRFVGTKPSISFDSQKQRQLTIIKGTKEAPFTMNLDTYRQLKIKDAERLFKKIQEVSGLPLESEESSSEPSSQKEEDTR